MTCTTCPEIQFAAVPRTPSFAARMLAVLGRLRPTERLDLESLSYHRLRDLGLADRWESGPRHHMWD